MSMTTTELQSEIETITTQIAMARITRDGLRELGKITAATDWHKQLSKLNDRLLEAQEQLQKAREA